MVTEKRRRSKRKAVPLAPPPSMRSRKKARVVTTLFHKYTRERDEAIRKDDMERVRHLDLLIHNMGGREEYQRASQLSTKFHSTSRWVLGYLTRCGWLYGIPEHPGSNSSSSGNAKRTRPSRRNLRLLEVGAINTELLDAAAETLPTSGEEDGGNFNALPSRKVPKYRLEVRAIDLHSSHEGIEEADFLTFPVEPENKYDVVVCSMVINCVTTPEDRGLMLTRLFRQLRPGGLCFLTLPRLCLTQSPYITPELFKQLLSRNGIGFYVEETKESPKVAFYVLRRPEVDSETRVVHRGWTELKTIQHGGKQLRNQFGIVLQKNILDEESTDV